MENEDRVRELVYSENIERYIKENDLFRGAHPKGKIYIPSAQFVSGAQVGSARDIAEIPFASEPVDDAALPIARGQVGAIDNSDDVDGIPPVLTSDSEDVTPPRELFRSPLEAISYADFADEEPTMGGSYRQTADVVSDLLPDGSIMPFRRPFQLSPSRIPLDVKKSPQPRFSLYRPSRTAYIGLAGDVEVHAQTALHNPFIVMPPSRIPVPGTGQFIFLGGVVNSQFGEITSQADVKTRAEKFGVLVINAYQTEPRSDETPLHERLRDEVAALQDTHRTSNFADIGYHHVDLQDSVSASVSDDIFIIAPLIDAALATNRQVFVYCGKGVSRSATLVLGYLILAKNMTNDEANEHVCLQRAVAPNLGFGIALCNLARYNSRIIGSREETATTAAEETLSKITLAEKILAIQAMIRAEQERSRVDEPASPVSPSAIAVPLVQQSSPVDSYGACCGGGHSYRESDIEPGTNPCSASMGSAPRSWGYRASGSHRGVDPVIDDRQPGDEEPDYCFAHSVGKMHWLHQPATVVDHPNQDGPLAPLPGSTEVEERKSPGSPTV